MEFLQLLQDLILKQRVLGESVFDWLVFLSVWAVAALLLSLLHRFLLWRLTALTGRSTSPFATVAVAVVRRTRWYFLIAAGLYIASRVLQVPAPLESWLSTFTFLVLILQIIAWGYVVIDEWVNRYRQLRLETDAAAVTTVEAIGWVARLAVWVVVLLLLLDHFGKDVTALVTGLGIGGVAVALAVQNILGDLFASLSIVLDKPFVVGDSLTIDTFTGTVESIGLKTTRLRSISGEQITFSNGDLLKSRIRNYKRMFERRVVFTIGVTYQTMPEKLQAIPGILREIIETQDPVRFDRAHLASMTDYALKFEAVYFVLTPDYQLHMDIQQTVFLEVIRRFAADGIEFAFPTQSLIVETLPIQTQDTRPLPAPETKS